MRILELQRRIRGLSQDQLGQHILYSRTVISRLETETLHPGDVHPRLRAALETFFGDPLERLLSSVEVSANHCDALDVSTDTM
jgi:ribosome-binding protein aMBF1 (putative translation factor)